MSAEASPDSCTCSANASTVQASARSPNTAGSSSRASTSRERIDTSWFPPRLRATHPELRRILPSSPGATASPSGDTSPGWFTSPGAGSAGLKTRRPSLGCFCEDVRRAELSFASLRAGVAAVNGWPTSRKRAYDELVRAHCARGCGIALAPVQAQPLPASWSRLCVDLTRAFEPTDASAGTGRCSAAPDVLSLSCLAPIGRRSETLDKSTAVHSPQKEKGLAVSP